MSTAYTETFSLSSSKAPIFGSEVHKILERFDSEEDFNERDENFEKSEDSNPKEDSGKKHKLFGRDE